MVPLDKSCCLCHNEARWARLRREELPNSSDLTNDEGYLARCTKVGKPRPQQWQEWIA